MCPSEENIGSLTSLTWEAFLWVQWHAGNKVNTVTVWIRVYMAIVTHHHQKQGREERAYFSLQSTRKESQDRNSKQRPGGRSWSGIQGGTLSTDLQLIACSAWVLIYPRTTCLGVISPIVIWALPHQLRKFPTDLPTSNVMGAFSHLRFPLPRYV